MSTNKDQGPDLAAVLELIGPVLAAYEGDERYLLTALAERIAASRYREWAEQVDDAGERAELLACAAREEDIASRIEALRDDAAEIQEKMLERHAELPAGYAGLFSQLSLRDQFALQALAERAGASTWRGYAEEQTDPAIVAVLEACAPLEEESAACLEALVAKRDAG